MDNKSNNVWLEINTDNLVHNLFEFRRIIGKDVRLAPAVKGNAYGHGLKTCAKMIADSGIADYLCVNALFEAEEIRRAGIKIPMLIIGYVQLCDLEKVVNAGFEIVVYSKETLKKLGSINKAVDVHLKIETGNNRQGILTEEIPIFAGIINKYPNINLKGVSTHFADIEDNEEQEYASKQLAGFNEAISILKENGLNPVLRHCANTAASILMPDARFNMVRTGIGNYGLWPSENIERMAKKAGIDIELRPVMTVKTIVAQIKYVKKGEKIGYGGTYVMPSDGRIAVLPIGYFEGFDRKNSNNAYVLINGKRAPVRGRVCMNMIMAEITEIPDVQPEDEVVIMGRQGDEVISAEEIAERTGTINYEVTTRMNII